jgi:chromate transporter
MGRMPVANPVPFRDAVREWWRIGWLGFGGPAGQIALMHRVLVDERHWLGESEFLRGLNFCMLLPGPEAQQLAIYAGWRLHGFKGGLVAGTLFVLPGALLVFALAALYLTYGAQPAVGAVFFGVKAAVLALIAEALMRVGRRALASAYAVAVAFAAFAALAWFGVPFPAVVVGAALAGLAGRRWLVVEGLTPAPVPRPSVTRTLGVLALGLAIWLAPLVALALALGAEHRLVTMARFFSEMAVVTFGGAYAVLAWVAQAAVETHGWLTATEMLDGLGLAESTPGPLILVLEFVGALAGFRAPAPFAPWTGALAGAVVVLWATFVPCFTWIFAGAPWVERLAHAPRASAALAGVTAAVVGTIAHLGLWSAWHTLFAEVGGVNYGALKATVPVWDSFDWRAAATALVALALLASFKRGVLVALGATVAVGLLLQNLT